jgi:hypothetical protein
MPSILDHILSLFAAKKPVPTPLRTKALSMLPARAREEAFFSATVEDARLLEEMQARVAQEIASVENGGGIMSRGRFIAEMKQILGVAPDGDGGGSIEKVGSHNRLKLIHDFNVQRAHEARNWTEMTQDDDARDRWPAQELLRVGWRDKERDWPRRWADAGGKFYDGRMIARVDDPIWRRISRFDTPYPPFDYGSGMGTEIVSREEAEDLGVIEPGEEVAAPPNPVTEPLTASVASLGDEGTDFLRSIYGTRLVIHGGVASLDVSGAILAANARRRRNTVTR